MKQEIKKINDLLLKKYGVPHRSEIPPKSVDLLIATILSQNTNDKNSFRAFQNLKNNYADWDSVSKLSIAQIEKEIKVAGLSKQKSKSIKNFLVTIKKEKGKISLEHLIEMNNEKVILELTKFNGIGVKTASCVLLFSMRRNVCPVDTHVHRTTNRIGIVKTNSPDITFKLLNKNLPENIAHQFHTNLIKLGREICKPTNPKCSICPLEKVCRYEFKILTSKSNYKENNFLLLDSIK